MKMLVTGASGFLGTALCTHLEAAGHAVYRVSTKNCDLTRQDALTMLPDEQYERIFHLAAWTQAGDFCLTHAGEQWIINQQINTNVLAWWRERQPQAKMIAIGTSCAYDPNLPLAEEHYLTGVPIDSLFTYAMTKRMLYAGLLALHKQFGLRYLCAVPSTLFGPGYHTDGRQMHFIFDLIRKIMRGKRYSEPVVLWGDGNQRRELVYLPDFISILNRLTDTVDNDLVNIGAGEEYTIRDFAQAICARVGYDPAAIQYDIARYVGAKSKCLETGKLRRLLPDLRLTPLPAALDATITWFEESWEQIEGNTTA
ncbi:MAG: NAD-dependent epimerase/dehydratase family protein [Armatimonadota bacterium]